MRENERSGRHLSLNERLLFESGSPGRRGYRTPVENFDRAPLSELIDPDLTRDSVEDMPELAESEVVRHFTRLSTWNYHIDLGLYPLGSCTMKYNPKVNERIARLPGFASIHPYLPEELVQGALTVQKLLEDLLAEITGMKRVTLQPAAGAHGELTGLLMIRAWHESRGRPRKFILVPDSAHGTNPASTVISGYRTVNIPSTPSGTLDLDAIRRSVNEDVAGIMITNPNTLGIFEHEIASIAESMHAHGALVYMDGANMNAMMGVARPGDFGVDVLHLNLHKTFSTPHGGGGPGSGPVAVGDILEPFLPVPLVERAPDGSYYTDGNRPQSIGRVKAYHGQFGMHCRALAYILAMGAEGLREASEVAVLNANYIRSRLEGEYELPYRAPTLHEVVFSDRRQAANGVRVGDIAKRLMDYGFHPPTVAFPLIVSGGIMIEPTETESREELDAFISAMLQIARECATDPDMVRSSPHSTRLGRVDETSAARRPVLRWTR